MIGLRLTAQQCSIHIIALFHVCLRDSSTSLSTKNVMKGLRSRASDIYIIGNGIWRSTLICYFIYEQPVQFYFVKFEGNVWFFIGGGG